jgi:hypothetical protein
VMEQGRKAMKEYGFPGFHFHPIKVGEDHP